MEINWDSVVPTGEQWQSLGGCAFECLEDINGQQSTISSRALLELLHHLGEPLASAANLTKSRMAALIVCALVPHEGWATSELGNICLVSSSHDSPDLPSIAFDLELTSEPQVRLFFPAGGVTLTAEVGPENEVAPPNTDAATTEQQPGAPDLAAILAAISGLKATNSQAFAQQNTSPHNFEVTVDCRLWDQRKELSQQIDLVRCDLATDFQQCLDAVGLDFQKEVVSLQQQLSRMEQQQMGSHLAPTMSTPMTDSSTLSSDSLVPALETSLLWAAKLAAVNPTQQNPKLNGQALSAMPPALKLF